MYGGRGHHDAPQNYRPASNHNEQYGRMYDDRSDRYDSRDRYRRSPSPHDYHRDVRKPRYEDQAMHSYRNADMTDDRDRHSNDHYSARGRSSSPSRMDRGSYRDRDREGYRSPRSDDRSPDRVPRKGKSPYYGGPPSREVIMEGLPLDLAEEDLLLARDHVINFEQTMAKILSVILQILQQLKELYGIEDIDDIRVIRERQSKVSRGFGFLRFSTIEKAKSFMEPNFPTINFRDNSIEDDQQTANVRIAFSRERDDPSRTAGQEGEWICRICSFSNFPTRQRCHKCQTPQPPIVMPTAPAKVSNFLNSGASDVSPDGTPSQFLLLRGLEPSVTEDLLAKGATKLIKPSKKSSPPPSSKKGNAKVASTTGDANLGAREGSLRRVLLVRSRRNSESWRYGFAEFTTIDDAQAALIRYNSFEKFTIASKPVTVDYVHAGIFVPVFDIKQGSERFTFSPLSNSAIKLAYWDEEAWVSELTVTDGRDENIPANNAQGASAADNAVEAAEGEGLVKSSMEGDGKSKKRKGEAKAAEKQKKTTPAHLQFWSNRHAELHGIKPDAPSNDQTGSQAPASNTKQDRAVPPQNTFTDPTKHCCYLCSRQFKSTAEANKHERLSQLHRDNLEKPDLVTKATTKMERAGHSTSLSSTTTPMANAAPTADSPNNVTTDTAIGDGPGDYRDRAAERRQAFGTSKKISLPLKKSLNTSSSTTTANPNNNNRPSSPPSKTDGTPQTSTTSKGMALLGKMGWSAGDGLGAQGTGRTDTIAQDMYVAGVGLGAQGGKVGDAVEEAERNTKGGYKEFVGRTREKARERYEGL